jgi:hypothetical protein
LVRFVVTPAKTPDQTEPLQFKVVPVPPTAQTFCELLPQMPLTVEGSGTLDQTVPFQCAAPAPTAQTSFAPLPQTLESQLGCVRKVLDQTLPFQFMRSPSSVVLSVPTTQTLFELVPQTAWREMLSADVRGTFDQEVPFQLNNRPPCVALSYPTAQASLLSAPHTPVRVASSVTPEGTLDHAVPFQCRIVARKPGGAGEV